MVGALRGSKEPLFHGCAEFIFDSSSVGLFMCWRGSVRREGSLVALGYPSLRLADARLRLKPEVYQNVSAREDPDLGGKNPNGSTTQTRGLKPGLDGRPPCAALKSRSSTVALNSSSIPVPSDFLCVGVGVSAGREASLLGDPSLRLADARLRPKREVYQNVSARHDSGRMLYCWKPTLHGYRKRG
jgi:hypothetical protein